MVVYEEWWIVQLSGDDDSFQNAAAPSPLGQMPPQDGMPGGPMPGGPGFFPVSTVCAVKTATHSPLSFYYKPHSRHENSPWTSYYVPIIVVLRMRMVLKERNE